MLKYFKCILVLYFLFFCSYGCSLFPTQEEYVAVELKRMINEMITADNKHEKFITITSQISLEPFIYKIALPDCWIPVGTVIDTRITETELPYYSISLMKKCEDVSLNRMDDGRIVFINKDKIKILNTRYNDGKTL
jgi:hypothetical protein